MLTRRQSLALALSLSGMAGPALAQSRRRGLRFRALCIGIGYSSAPPVPITALANAVNDAKLMARSLNQILPESTTSLIDPDKSSLDQALETFLSGLSDKIVAIVYYAGHGVQVDGRNYLVTADGLDLVPLDAMIERMRSRSRACVALIDACRDNPFLARKDAAATATNTVGVARSVRLHQGAARGLEASGVDLSTIPFDREALASATGLARFQLKGTGVMVAFSTDPGNVALDGVGPNAINSPFARALADQIGAQESLDDILASVSRAVLESTDRKQSPWRQGSLDFVVYLAGEPNRIGGGEGRLPIVP